MRRRPLRRLSIPLAYALAVTVSLVGCGGGDEPVAPLTGQHAGESIDVGTESPEPNPARPLASFAPRSVAYLNADITVTEVEVSQETPGSYGEATVEYGEARYAYLTVTVSNRLNHTSVLINDGIFLDIDGELIAHTGRNPAVRNVSAGTTATGWYGFELPAGAGLEGAALVLGDPGYRQERLPLTGPVPEPEYPRPIRVDSPGTVFVRNGCPLEVEIAEAYLAHWVGFDDKGKSHVTRQAEQDRLMLYLGLEVTAPAGSRACFLATGGSGDVHLVVDGQRLGDIPRLNSTTNVAEGTTAHQYLVYDIPATGEVEIEWGRLGGEQVRTPVPVS